VSEQLAVWSGHVRGWLLLLQLTASRNQYVMFILPLVAMKCKGRPVNSLFTAFKLTMYLAVD
jgi:hypothetical protein